MDPARDRILLAEMADEVCHVPHHPQKIAFIFIFIFIFSAMRHFAEALLAQLDGGSAL
jgi:deoxyribodipyrimidine photolyase-related protein